jgi:hypothetical protein
MLLRFLPVPLMDLVVDQMGGVNGMDHWQARK